jgi:hypothetical protein
MPKSATTTLKKSNTTRVSGQSHKVKSGNGYDLVICLLELLLSVKFYHWRTSSYSTHKATDELYGDLNDNIDEFAETLMGTMGSRIPSTNKLHLTIPSDNKHMGALIDKSVNLLADFDFNKLSNSANTTTTDLMNMRDEMVGQLHKTKYLLSLDGVKK